MRTIACIVGAALLAPLPVPADIITFELGYEFSDFGTSPTGPAPWLCATFDDGGTPGSVDLLLETPNIVDAETVFLWMFNLDPALDPNALVFSAPTKTGAFDDPTISTEVDGFMADGDGLYDIKFQFAQNDGAPTRFGSGDAVAYTITGIPSLVANSFYFMSHDNGGHGPFLTAAHVACIAPDNTSGWITVPEPATGLLFLAALCAVRRKR